MAEPKVSAEFKRRMKAKGIRVLDLSNLECDHCGSWWSPNIQSGGRLPRGYWKCPQGCNENA